MIPSPTERFHYLDGLRGLAAIAVFYSHLFGTFGFPPAIAFIEDTPIRIFWHGEGAVLFFFMLSGFVLSHQLFKAKDILSNNNLFRYILLRINRIYPAFALTVLATFFLRKYLYFSGHELPHPSEWILKINGAPMTTALLIKELAVIFPIQADERIMPQGWSLVLEILISTILPFLFVLTQMSRWGLLFFSYFCVKLLNLEGSVFTFICGSYLYLHRAAIQTWINQRTRSFKLMTLGVAWLLFTCRFFLPEKWSGRMDRLFTSALLPGCILLFMLMMSSSRVKKILEKQPFQFLGKISYSNYLIHFTLILCVAPAVSSMVNAWIPFDEYYTRIAIYLCMSVIMLVVSSLLCFGIELPLLEIGKRRIKALFS